MSCKIPKNCVVCSSEFLVYPSMYDRFVTCSRKCVKIHKESYNNGNWRGGVKGYRAAEVQFGVYKAWRRYVLMRDGYKCILCKSSTKLQADHIKPWALYPSLRYDVNNGRTLCYDCHKKTFKQFYKDRAELEKSGYKRPTPCRKQVALVCQECKVEFFKKSSCDKFCTKKCQRRNGARRWRSLHYKSGELRLVAVVTQ